MFKLTGKLFVVMVFGWVGSASAAMMPPIAVDGREWLQPIDFLHHSWNEVSTVCNAITGTCTGSLAGNDLTGWTWASVDDVNSLFNHYIGSAELGPGPDNTGGPNGMTPGDNWLTEMMADGFIPTYTIPEQGYVFITTFFRTTNADGVPYAGGMQYGCYDICPFQSANTDGTWPSDYSDYGTTWFTRDPASGVPSPATFPLLGLGLAALGYSCRKHKMAIKHTLA
jgi:hypothetical protein